MRRRSPCVAHGADAAACRADPHRCHPVRPRGRTPDCRQAPRRRRADFRPVAGVAAIPLVAPRSGPTPAHRPLRAMPSNVPLGLRLFTQAQRRAELTGPN